MHANTSGLETHQAIAPERGMRLLLTFLIALIVVTDILDLGLSMGPGMSAKNAMLYVIAVALLFKIVVQQNFVFELRALHFCFAILVIYSLLSIITAYFVVQYPGYKLFASIITLKSRLVDHALFFLVFFYALRESRNAHSLLKVLLLAAIIGNAIAFLNALGYTSIGEMETRKDGRMTGVMGESNQDGAWVALFIPALAAAMIVVRGAWRLLWLVGLCFSAGVMVLTASRGAYVAIIVAALGGILLFKRYFSLGKMMAIASGGAVVIAIMFAALSVKYGDLLYKRIIGDTTSSDMVGASSGRVEIWSTALALMGEKPLTFISGFGWNVYWSLPTRLSPHNYYLSLWFNVGLVGLICGTALLVLVAREAFRAVPGAEAEYRPVLISFVIGTIAISVATFFVDLYTPWLWFWAYAGLVMRIAVNAYSQRSLRVPEQVKLAKTSPTHDPFGWVGTAQQ